MEPQKRPKNAFIKERQISIPESESGGFHVFVFVYIVVGS